MVPVPTGVGYASGDSGRARKKAVVVGFGMVGVAFVEKLLQYDLEGGRDEWEVIVVGEEPHVAYNRVGLTGYFNNRSIESLYLNPLEWYKSHAPGKLTYHTGDLVTRVDSDAKLVHTSKGFQLAYDACILATGSDAALPPYISQDRFRETQGTFVYRNLADLESMIDFAKVRKPVKRAAVVGGGLLGLEAAKALLDLEEIEQVVLIERNQWVLSRQLDGEGGRMVLEKVRQLGVEVLLQARVRQLVFDGSDQLEAVLLDTQPEPTRYDLDMIVFAVGIKPRDDLATASGLTTAAKGGIAIEEHLRTSASDVFAIGECASWKGETWGLIGPGISMAEVLAFNLTEGPYDQLREMLPPDVSTKLKLMGVDVASFGDYFADHGKLTKPLPGAAMRRRKGEDTEKTTIASQVKTLTFRDPFNDVYKKYIFTADGQYVVGGMMVGDVGDFVKLVSLVNKGKPIGKPPAEFIIGAKKEGEDDSADLDDDAVVCSCHNVTKGAVVKKVKAGCRSLGDIKSTTKCGTGCGGCMPLATSIFHAAMKAEGVEVSNHLCPHFKYTRQELFTIIKFKKELRDFAHIMRAEGNKPDSLGCEVCRPAVSSILSSLYNESLMKPGLRSNTDTNDRFFANIQRDGTYSIVPRLVAGEVSPEKLIVLGEIAKKYNLYTKITGGQRIDMFGAKKSELAVIWEELLAHGFESGHAYGKSLRTVKSCVGSSWCRFGVGDSVGLAVELEERYKSIRAPHKFKGGVSGCVRECAEAQSKDFGVIATPKGWNVYVAGNGGASPRHADLLAEDVGRRMVVRLLDRFIMFYVRTAAPLQRTARWLEQLPNGLETLKEVVVQDKLGICAELEEEMQQLVGTFHDEWADVVKNPSYRAKFRQFVNTDETQNSIERTMERGQPRPVDWPETAGPLKFSREDIMKNATWKWTQVCSLADLEPDELAPSSAVIKYGDTQIAVFHLPGGRGLRASQNMCPHKRAFVLADGLVGEDAKGRPYVSCPLHKRNYNLSSDAADEGGACNDADYQIMTFEAKLSDDKEAPQVLLYLPETNALDAVLSTTKWMIRKAQEESESMLLAANGGEKRGNIEIAGPKADLALNGAEQATSKKAPVASCGGGEGGALDW